MKTALSKFNLKLGLIICLLFGTTSIKAQNISFSVDSNTGCVPLSINITNTSDTAGINFLWIVYEEATEELDTISSGFEPNLTLTEPGEFVLYLLAYNSSDSLVGSDFQNIWTDGAGTSFYQSADTICPGDNIFIAFQGEAWDYYMDFGDGTDNSGTCCMYHTYNDDGIYDITLILETDCGVDTLIQELVVDSNAVPYAMIYASGNNACPGDSIYFYSNTEPDDLEEFYWVANNDTVYTETTVYGFADIGSYTVELHLTNTCGNSSISTYNVSISDSNSLMVWYEGPMEICPGQDGYFSADIDNPYSSATIYYGDGTSENYPVSAEGLFHAYTDTGTYSTMFIVTNGCGNVDTSYSDVTVREDTNQYFNVGFYTLGEPSTGVEISFWPYEYDGELTYIWDFGNGDSTYSVYPSMIYTDTGTYVVTLTMISPCGPQDSFSDTIYIQDGKDTCNYPFADFGYYPDSICPGGTVEFESYSWDANYVRWYFGDGTSSTDEYTTHTYANAGTYNIMLVAYSDCASDTANWGEIYVGNVDPIAWIEHYPDSVCINDTVYMLDYMVFVGDEPSTSNTYNIDYGDGTIDFTSTLIDEIFIGKHVYGANGTYNVTVTVENECGGIAVFYDTVRVISSAPANADILTWNDGDDDSLWVCPGDQIELWGFGGVVYDWDFGDGTSSTDKNVTISYTGNGIYILVLTTTNGCANQATDTLVINVNSNNVPEVNAWDESGNDICAGNYKSFNSYVENYDYLMWTFGDGAVSFEDAPTHYFDTPGLYEVILFAYNACGAGSDTIAFEVYEVPIADFDLDTNYVANVSTPLGITNNSINISTSYWMFGDGTSSWNDSTTLQHTYDDSGVYKVTLVVWNIEGCGDTTSLSVIVGTNPSTIDLCDSLYVDFESDAFFGIGQAGQQIVFTDYSEDGLGSVNAWDWNFGDGNTSSVQNPTHTYSNSGTYTVTLTATTDFGCSDSATATLLIFPSDTSSLCDNTNADFTASSTTVSIDELITFTNNSSSDAFILGYLWAFGDDSTSLGKNPTHSYSSAGIYNVTLSMMDLNLCTDTVTLMITVDSTSSIFEATIGKVTFNVYPNPFADNTTIEYSLPENVKSSKIVIIDITGKIIESIDLEPRSNLYHFNGNNYDQGIYSCILLVDGIPTNYNKLVITR